VPAWYCSPRTITSRPFQIASENFDYGRELAEKIFGAIQEAKRNEQGPIHLLFGNGYGYFTRSQLSFPPDYEIQLLKVMAGERTLALLFNHPTHPQMGPRNLYGPSHPGFAMDEIARFPGSTATTRWLRRHQYARGGADPLAACQARARTRQARSASPTAAREEAAPIESARGGRSASGRTCALPARAELARGNARCRFQGVPRSRARTN
jgi:hypothetical protein